ncbi:MAG: galactokinase [Lentisphaerae bacterium]|nr:galactokinase [Lentisphaerota bacterium]
MNPALPEHIRRSHAARFGCAPERMSYAPGRAEILGNHTDYNGGLTLSTAIDRGIWLAVSRGLPDRLRLQALDLGAEAESAWPVPGPLAQPGWANYLLGVAHGLPPEASGPQGYDISFAGDIPRGAGLSSSAALEVATALALLAMNHAELPLPEIARLCQRAENEFAGAQCGLLDQLSVLYGRADALVAIDFQDLRVSHAPLPAACIFLLADTGVRHDLVECDYNDRRAQCEAAARFFAGALARPVGTLREVTMAEWQACRPRMDPVMARRARHVIAENARVREALCCLELGDLERFGALMFESHASSRDDFENSCPELDFLVERARLLPGVIGARLSGGGFGGSVVIMTAPDAAENAAARLAAAYAERFAASGRIRSLKAADGARLI